MLSGKARFSTIKKIISIILFIVGGICLFSGILITTESLIQVVDITNMFIVKIVGLYALSIACMVLGISMSYKEKWNQVLGIECMIIGIFLVMAGIALIIAMHINKISNYEGFAAYFTSIGLCVLILGLCFIGNQKKIDFEINRNKIVKKNSH